MIQYFVNIISIYNVYIYIKRLDQKFSINSFSCYNEVIIRKKKHIKVTNSRLHNNLFITIEIFS